jgi:polyferredoxin
MRRLKYFTNIAIFLLFVLASAVHSQQRFPKPEFETGYEQPTPETPEPRALALEYFDVVVLLAVLFLSTWFVLKKRSRRGVLWTSVFTLIYFGFYRDGCICSIGSIQNVALSLFDSGYSISLMVLAFFLIPLLFSLFYGRIFCASACPLGAIQDLIVIKPIPVAPWLRTTLGLLPFIYLGLSVLFAATGTDFIICRYDPFVGIFRMDGPFHMILLGISFLLMGLFVARPYCRFLCPYGALLKVTSTFSKRHLSITPSKCIQCKLCANSCPFDAIDEPTDPKLVPNTSGNIRKFIIYAALIPIFMFLGGYAVSSAHRVLSKVHPDVYLAELLVAQPELRTTTDNLDIETFMGSGKSLDTLVDEAKIIQQKYKTGGWYLGAFLGLVFGLTLLNQVIFRRREDYQPNKGDCVSCGRCMDFCPVEK